MQENEFEKRVHEKMTELGFDPSDSVWARVEKEINPERKHRRPLFWMFFLSGILLAGAGYYITTMNGAKQYPLNEVNKKTKNESAIALQDKNKNREEKSKAGHADADHIKSDADSIKITSLQNNHESLNRRTETSNKAVIRNMNAESSASTGTGETGETSVLTSSTTPAGSATAIAENQNQTHSVYSQDSMKSDVAAVKKLTPDSAAITKMKSNTESAKYDSAAAKTAKTKKKSPWQVGLTAGAGVSNINQSLFKSASVPANAYLSAGIPAGGPGGGLFYSSPEFHTGFSFGVGAFARRKLSGRFYISGGLEYHFYSNKINTGNQLLNTSALNPALLSTYNASAFYQFGNNQVYTNRYHFLQFPLSAGWQLNKNRKHPITWETGLSPAWLMASSALQFDPSTGILYKSNHNLNKFQMNAGTAVLIGIPSKRAAWQAGPEIQYGLTGLTSAASGNSQHLLYYGLKVSFIPAKK